MSIFQNLASFSTVEKKLDRFKKMYDQTKNVCIYFGLNFLRKQNVKKRKTLHTRQGQVKRLSMMSGPYILTRSIGETIFGKFHQNQPSSFAKRLWTHTQTDRQTDTQTTPLFFPETITIHLVNEMTKYKNRRCTSISVSLYICLSITECRNDRFNWKLS